MIPKNLLPVIDSGMCIGCGACVAADPSLELEFDARNQMWQPNGPGNHAAAGVCPAIAVDFAGLHDRLFPGSEVGPHGVVEKVYLAQSTDLRRNLAASSGGLIKELMLHLLRSGQVDGVIALTHIQGLDFEPRLITELAEVDDLPGSIYHHVAFDGALKILRETPGRFVLVAIPCQLEGIFTHIFKNEPELRERIALTIGLLCGWLYSHHALRALAHYKGVPYRKVHGVGYRGEGPVGKLTLDTDDGPVAVSRRVDFDYQVAFDRSFNTPRCHVCINHSNFLADVVVGDAWLPSTVTTKTGISLVTCRTAASAVLLTELADQGRIVASEVTTDEITESQTHRVVFGDFAYPYAEYLKEIGRHVPEMTGPNRSECRPVRRDQIEKFDSALLTKLKLQRSGRYQRLWWRKATVEAWPLAKRYLTWFFVRILRIKSLTGRRTEVDRSKISIFR